MNPYKNPTQGQPIPFQGQPQLPPPAPGQLPGQGQGQTQNPQASPVLQLTTLQNTGSNSNSYTTNPNPNTYPYPSSANQNQNPPNFNSYANSNLAPNPVAIPEIHNFNGARPQAAQQQPPQRHHHHRKKGQNAEVSEAQAQAQMQATLLYYQAALQQQQSANQGYLNKYESQGQSASQPMLRRTPKGMIAVQSSPVIEYREQYGPSPGAYSNGPAFYQPVYMAGAGQPYAPQYVNYDYVMVTEEPMASEETSALAYCIFITILAVFILGMVTVAVIIVLSYTKGPQKAIRGAKMAAVSQSFPDEHIHRHCNGIYCYEHHQHF